MPSIELRLAEGAFYILTPPPQSATDTELPEERPVPGSPFSQPSFTQAEVDAWLSAARRGPASDR